ncbi:MAG TPA: phospho-N-acetylmuramoyl-pentapeptide-transferase [Anaerolineaceae bacterium]
MKETLMAISLSMLCFMMTIIWGVPLLRILKHFRIGKIIRVVEPDRHFTKMGTPTMGGILFLLPTGLLTILLNGVTLIGYRLIGSSVLLPLLVMVGYGVMGAIDDWEGIRGKSKGEGMSARTKMIIQVVFAIVIALLLKYGLRGPDLFWPGAPEPIDLGVLYIPVAVFLIVAMSNAINFTDGLDGLAGLISATAFAAYGGIALIQGQNFIANFCFTLVGALFGFLWFNVHPAQLFMGDLGSQALGSTLAVVALMTGQWMLLPIIAIVPVSEALSVVIQIGYFKLTHGRRFFKMAPIHYHFELTGWSETQVVQRFWLVSLLCAMLGVALSMV